MRLPARIRATILTFITVGALAPAMARAQAGGLLSEKPFVPMLQEEEERSGQFGLHARLGSLFGAVDGADSYGELFNGGTGLELEASRLWRVGKWYLGPYLSLGWETYDGESENLEEGRLRPDDLHILSSLVGFKAVLSRGSGFVLDLHLAFGMASYSSVDGPLTRAGATRKVEVFDATQTFAFELGIRMGVEFGQTVIDFGVGQRTQGGPDDGDLNLSFHSSIFLYLEVGVSVNF